MENYKDNIEIEDAVAILSENSLTEADEKDDAAEDTDGGADKNDDAQSVVAEID